MVILEYVYCFVYFDFTIFISFYFVLKFFLSMFIFFLYVVEKINTTKNIKIYLTANTWETSLS